MLMTDTTVFGTYAPSGLPRRLIAATRAMPDTWLGRRTAYILRRVALSILRGVPLDVETLGARMRLYPYNNVCEKRVLFTPQYFDAQELTELAKRITEKCTAGDFIFVDIGANVGAYSLFTAAKAEGRARILAIEPQPEIFDRLTYNIRQNPFGCIKAIACAVADKTGELTLFVDSKNRGESSVKIVGVDQAQSMRVPAVTLLDLLRQEDFSRIDAVKLDVEGAEDLILGPFFRDAPESLHPDLLILEDGSEQWQTDIPALLASHGYRVIAQTRLNLIYEKKTAA